MQPIVGALLALAPLEALAAHARAAGRRPEQVVLLVKDAQGYGNLLRLLSRAYVEAEPGAEIRVSLAELAAHQHGLICSPAGRRARRRRAAPRRRRAGRRGSWPSSRRPSATGSMSS